MNVWLMPVKLVLQLLANLLELVVCISYNIIFYIVNRNIYLRVLINNFVDINFDN